ncbi:uncharacterized protein LOC129776840 [Toxorhynchites rutilus septentrionalis]|uniref:uncharacterized protein LOC129776840 n=1 Tax=Toxorhynchites rutilus septentrionalis TaxID=329112 RepID=UPI00247ADB4E|nr:uncharacterized protein LOC129776840 [Toxorhynchites rutilus septentrionalis]
MIFSSDRILGCFPSVMHNLMLTGLTLLMLLDGAVIASGEESPAQDFEIRYLSGEPDYKSVNLTWEVGALDDGDERHEPTQGADQGRRGRSFNVFYCELQNWGPHRCRSKILTDKSGDSGNIKTYTMTVNNLRMATKYSFHVKPQAKPGDQKASGRSEDSEDEFDVNSINHGQTVVIPTKGFSAHATQCLPHASEIEVKTGPFFGGRIGSENGNCGIQGDANSPQESYTMRIEHEKCGSRVSPEDLSVESYITVQENLGILTHSTRRFVVVCTFQPDTLTVRARLALPGKGKGGASPVPMSEWWPTNGGRNGRERHFNMVDKSSLVLKGSDEEEVEDISPAHVKEIEEDEFKGLSGNHIEESSNLADDTSKQELSSNENEIAEKKANKRRADKSEPFRDAKYARLFKTKAAATGDHAVDTTDAVSSEERITTRSASDSGSWPLDTSGLLISACLAIIMIGAFVYVLMKEFKKQRMIQQHQQHQQMQRPPNRMVAF